jgi:hypothetical protein
MTLAEVWSLVTRAYLDRRRIPAGWGLIVNGVWGYREFVKRGLGKAGV